MRPEGPAWQGARPAKARPKVGYSSAKGRPEVGYSSARGRLNGGTRDATSSDAVYLGGQARPHLPLTSLEVHVDRVGAGWTDVLLSLREAS